MSADAPDDDAAGRHRRLRIDGTCVIDPDEITWRFTTSGGPGGQHANKASTRVEATFDIERSPSLTEGQRGRLIEKLGPALTVVVDDTRSQARNRAIALERVGQRLAAGLRRDAPRRATRPSRAAKARRVDAKRRRSDTKRNRSRPGADD
jgi:ribosome-associated protein